MIKLILIALLLSACSTVKPPVVEYKIALNILQANAIAVGCRDKSLKVSQAFSSSSLMSLQMHYVQDKQKIYTYSQAQWNNSPNQEISLQIIKILRDSKLFKNTQSSKSRSKSDLILEINIEEFMQYFNKNQSSSYASAVIGFTLIDAKSSEVIATKTFSVNKNVEILDAFGGVKGLGSALEDILSQGVEFLNEVCK